MSPAARAELDAVLRRTRDPHVRDVVWACIEGRTTRRELRQDAAVTAELSALYEERFAAYDRRGVDFPSVRARVRDLAEAEDARHGTAYADRVTVAPDGA